MTYEVFEKFFRQFIRAGYIFGICLLIASLPHSKYGLSVSQFFLTGAFALERFDLKKFRDQYIAEKRSRFYLLMVPRILFSVAESIYRGFKVFFRNKPAMIFASIFLMHIIGLIFTTDFDYAFKDLRTKLPILLLPLFISTSGAFGKKSFYLILVLFSASVVARTLIGSWFLFHGNYVDIRDISRPVSHIILSLLISMTLFIQAYFLIWKRWYPAWMKALSFLVIAWLIVYIIITKSGTAIAVTGITLPIVLCVMIFRSHNVKIKLALALFLVLVSGSAIGYYLLVQKEYYTVKPVDFRRLDKFSRLGNPYSHNLQSGITENGNLVNIYIQWDELRSSWNQRSKINFDSLDRRNQPIKFTILRFLTSKGYRKDAEGVSKLSDREVAAIEKGVANVVYLKKFSIRGMIYELLEGYNAYTRTGNPTGNTLMQRLEFWKASVRLIRENPVTGVGTGDMNIAFHQEYEKMHTKLAPDQWWRSHNQFLSICVGFGFIGLAWFLFALLYPPARLNKFADYFFLVFFIIAMLSMMPEDTIESQEGVTFVAFFFSFFLFGRKEDDILRAG